MCIGLPWSERKARKFARKTTLTVRTRGQTVSTSIYLSIYVCMFIYIYIYMRYREARYSRQREAMR